VTTADEFSQALAEVRSVRIRPEFHIDEAPAPQRLAPSAVAITAESVHGDDSATGRFVLLHDPDGVDEWEGTFRAVVFVRAQVEADLVADPMLHEVAWAWLLEALDASEATAIQIGGTVTSTSGRSFGSMADRRAEGFLEIRGSWTPTAGLASAEMPGADTSAAAQMGRHVQAWMDLLAHAAGLTPLPPDVPRVDLGRGRART